MIEEITGLVHVAPRPGPVTALLQRAIDTGPAGLVLSLAAGEHHCGGLRLRSDMTLRLEEGAVLCFLPDYDAYRENTVGVLAEQSDRAMLVAKGAERLTVTGAGTLRCLGSTAYAVGDDPAMGTLIPAAERPRVLVLDACRDVTIEGISVEDAPMWTLHFVDCEGVRLHDLRIDNNRRMPNTDGVVIDGCRDVDIARCTIRTADDGIVLKTSARRGGGATRPCERIRAESCTIESRSCALKLGTESHADFRDIVFRDMRITASNRAIGLISRDGGRMEGVQFLGIEVACRETPSGFWGSGEAVTINTLDRTPDQRKSGAIRDVLIEDLSGTMEGAINLVRAGEGVISGVTLRRVAVTQTRGALGTGQFYDLRPTALDALPCDDAHGRVNAWRFDADGQVIGLHPYPGGLPGVFAQGIDNLVLEDVVIHRPDPLPDGAHPDTIVRLETAPA